MASPTESTTARWLRRALYFSASTLGISFLILLRYVAARSGGLPGDWLWYALAGSTIATFVTGIARFAYVLFAELQAPLNELLVTFLFAGGLMAILRSALRGTIDDDQTLQWVVFMLVVCVGVMLGSIWGWSAMKRTAERNARRRLTLLFFGWIGIVGFTGVAVITLLTVFSIASAIAGDSFYGSDFVKLFVGHLAAIPLAIPAFVVERRIKAAAKLGARPEQLATSATTAVEVFPISHPVSATSTPPGTPSI